MDVLTLFVIAGLLVILLDWMWKPKLNMPSPKRIPLVGHLLSFVKSPHMMLTAWADSCGDIYTVQLLNKCVVIVSGYETAHEVLVAKGKVFGGRAHTFRNDMISGKGKGIFLQSINPKWKRLRLFTQHNIKQCGEGLGRIEEMVQDTARQLNDVIWNESDKGVIDPCDHVYLTIANTMTMLITGKQMMKDDPLFKKIVEMERLTMKSITLDRGSELDVIPWLRFLGNKTFQDLLAVAKKQVEIYTCIKEMNRDCTQSTRNLAAALIQEMHHGVNANFLSDDIIKLVIFDILLAGVTTSAATLYMFLLIMASHPDIQRKIYEEITSITKGKDKDGEISLSDRQNMPYTGACLLELLRYISVVPLTMDHTALEDTEILGYKIPKGTAVYVNLFGLHHSYKYWDNPWNFDPRRFLSDGQLLPSDHINRKRLMAFGGGPRLCVGQSFAQARIFILMTSLIKTFEVRPVPGEIIQCDPRQFKLRAVLNAPRVELYFSKRL